MAARPTGEHLRADAPTYLRAVAEEIRRTTPPGDEDAAGLLAMADVFDAAAGIPPTGVAKRRGTTA